MNGSRVTDQIAGRFRVILLALCTMLAATLVAGTSPTYANKIAIVVNKTVITTGDIDRRTKLLRLQRTKGNLRKQAEDQLIEEAIKMSEARRLRAIVSDAQVNQSFARFAKSNKLSTKQMSQVLSQAGVGADHFKQFIRVQMSWPRVVTARYGSQGKMSTEELVSKMLELGGEKPSTTEYILQQVVFVVPKSKRNSILSKRKREADQMRGRFVSCDSTRQLAKGLRDVSVIDLGRVMQPALPRDWKPLVEKTSEGRTTSTRVTDRGVEFLAICSSKQVSDDLAAEMVFRSEASQNNQGGGANEKKYLDELRKQARISRR
ncbi:MAG: SurA N-terminal domain-containing protein [Alphaproteobacteria bacterium]|nr:SurA N-terminal domain-containing protein [Alphaproteobacteria bacterium]